MPTLFAILSLILVGLALLAHLVVWEVRRRQVEVGRAVYRRRHTEAMALVEGTVSEARRQDQARLAAEQQAAEARKAKVRMARAALDPVLTADDNHTMSLLKEIEELAEASPDKVGEVIRQMLWSSSGD